jgi:phosphate/sulfate permease
MAVDGNEEMNFLLAVTPTPTPTTIQAPPAGPIETIGAVIAIALALGAAILGYRIIRGGRGL